MSAYAHQMEREFSARSLSSRGGSEMESRYVIESGFYMTSFAATIFIGALVTVALLFITLLIALAVMLQSCENRSKGIVEVQIPNDHYSYCKIFALHAELNSIGPDNFPSFCRNLALQYIQDGLYEKDLNSTMQLILEYFDHVVPSNDGLDVVLMDIDDVLPSNSCYTYPLTNRLNHHGCSGCLQEARHLRQKLNLRLYTELHDRGWSMILLSRKPETLRNATAENLISAGYKWWSSLLMRLDDEIKIDRHVYFLKRRMTMQKEGFRISGVISSQMDALIGAFAGELIFKLPYPVNDYFDHSKMKMHDIK